MFQKKARVYSSVAHCEETSFKDKNGNDVSVFLVRLTNNITFYSSTAFEVDDTITFEINIGYLKKV